MIYDLNNEVQRSRFKRRCNDLYTNKCTVELTEKKQRTRSQNNYLHLIIGWFASETGNTAEYVKREYFKRHCNRDLFIVQRDDKLLGSTVEDVKSSRELTKEEMSVAIDRFRNWAAAEGGIELPSPDDGAFLAAIEVELSQNARFL